VLKDLKQSTKQRFMAIEFSYPPRDLETRIVEREAGVNKEVAVGLVTVGEKVRNLKNHGLEEGVSTRLLIYAGQLIKAGSDPRRRARRPSSGPSRTMPTCSTACGRSSPRYSEGLRHGY